MSRRSTGRPRGRPPHPEPLTPAEQRVLELVRAGKSNPEIAFALDLSLGTVKTHVSNMLSKLDLADRHELAEWQPGSGRAVGRWWGLAALAGLVRRSSLAAVGRRWWRPIGASLAASTIAALLAAVIAIGPARPAPSGGGAPVETGTPAATPPWDQLRRRPLQLPKVASGEACPVTPFRAANGGAEPVFGDGPVYPVGGMFAKQRRPDRFVSYLSWTRGTEYDGPVLVRGGRIDGAGGMRFKGPKGPAELRLDAAQLPTSLAASSDDRFERRLFVDAPGCYALQLDGTGFSDVVAFRVSSVRAARGGAILPTRAPQWRVLATMAVVGMGNGKRRTDTVALPAMNERSAATDGQIMTQFDELTSASWSPDGSRIAGVWTGSRQPYNWIELRTGFDGRDDVQFIRHIGDGPLASPTWSPDGQRIAVVGERIIGATLRQAAIFVVDVTSGSFRAIPAGASATLGLSWSPTGGTIAFVSETDGNPELHVIDLESGRQQRLTDNPEFDGYPAWSPDGAWILFESNRAYRRGIWLVRPDGSDLHQLAPGPATDWFPSWSPDGTQVVFSSNRDGAFRLYRVNVDGSALTALEHGGGSDWAPRYAPGGDRLLFLSSRNLDPDEVGLHTVSGSPVVPEWKANLTMTDTDGRYPQSLSMTWAYIADFSVAPRPWSPVPSSLR